MKAFLTQPLSVPSLDGHGTAMCPKRAKPHSLEGEHLVNLVMASFFPTHNLPSNWPDDFFFFFFVFLPFLGLLLQHMEVPRLGVESEL